MADGGGEGMEQGADTWCEEQVVRLDQQPSVTAQVSGEGHPKLPVSGCMVGIVARRRSGCMAPSTSPGHAVDE
jgi:hypothetical protein